MGHKLIDFIREAGGCDVNNVCLQLFFCYYLIAGVQFVVERFCISAV